MKNYRLGGAILALLFIGLSTWLGFAHTKPAQNWSAWSQFKLSDCYKGISYRFRERTTSLPDKNQIQIEIKNSYANEISIRFRVTNNPNEKALYRRDIGSRGSYTVEEYVLKDKPFHFLHDQMRFKGDKYGDPFRKCDR